MVDGGPWDNATIDDTLIIVSPNPALKTKLTMGYFPLPTPGGVLIINQGLEATKDIAALGNLSTESPTKLSFSSTGYTNCARTDIGKLVKCNGTILEHTVLIAYDNLDRRWWLSKPHNINIGDVLTLELDGQPGQGTGTRDDREGFLNTGGGAIMIGKGYERFDDPPRICLTNGNTLYVTEGSSANMPNGADDILANLKVKDLEIAGELKLKSQNGKIFGVAAGDNGTADAHTYLIPINPPGGMTGLGTYAYPFLWVDTVKVFTDEIVNLHSTPRIRFRLNLPQEQTMSRSSAMMLNSAVDEETLLEAVVIDNDSIAGLKQKHLNGLVDEWYSDEEETLKAKVDGTTGNLYISGNIEPLGAQGYIGFNTKLRLSGDFQIANGHVVSSLNPSGTVALGSPTEPWEGVAAQTVYTESIKHLNGSDWNIPQVQKGSVTTNASGVASVTFSQAFASTPTVTCTAVDASGRPIAVVITAQSATQFSIKTTLTGDHKHKVGDIFGTETFGLSVNSVSDHTHSYSAASHTHMIGTISATASWAMGIDSQGSHNHTVVGTTGVGGSHNHSVVGTTGSGSSHYHNMQSHTHSINMGSTNTGSTSGHTHTYAYSQSPTAGPSNNSTTNESSHTHNYSGYSSTVDNHAHNYSGYSGDNGSHSHNLTNKPPYVRSLMLRDSAGTQQDLGALLTNTTGSQFDLYTLSGGSGSGTTGASGGHTHGLSGNPAYTRGVSLRNSSGGSFTIGGVLSNDSVVGTTEAHTENTNPASNIAITVNWIAVG